ncbi:DUF551 domain-containing protein [Klebsiella pneumoniae]|nr:hypothetical protein [Klebsiella pneumoniae]UOP96339.1 DUF551 domain-containing protein [Klebsiella pneumoniae]SVP41818.1 Uncharacterised protein [Klebsiella pneumoniae]SXN08049.1 Uncharacterised protein [Klebsiella pneumoniae]
MTKSTITRERIQRIIRAINSEAYDEEEIREWLSSDEIMELSRIALAAMDSESGCLPLDYLQGHKDGLEWAAQLAEANHPETGDWLYDDPIDLAKAIRKGPDMPPAQPVADSEPVAWTWQHLKQWHVTNDEERARDLAWDGVKVEPLYRHAQPVPVVSAELLHTAASAIEDLLTTKDRTGAGVWFDLPFRLRSAANAQPALVVPDEIKHRIGGLDWGWEGEFNRGWNACRAAMLHAGNSPAKNGVAPAQSGNSPAIPDGYVLVSKEARKEILDEFDSIIDYGAEDSVDAWHRLLAAATQEVKP